MVKPPNWMILIFCLTLASTRLCAGELAELAKDLEDGHYTQDADALRSLADTLSEMEGELARYYEAYAHFRLGELAGDNKKAAKKHFNTCINILKPEAKARPADAETQGLLGTCFGSSTVYYMLRAATRGAASDKALKAAIEAAPDNPRILMHSGISLFYRPKAFGGDKPKALEQFGAATENFASGEGSAAASAAPSWGEAEAWAYLARARAALEQPAAAREAYLRALELRPDYSLARQELAALDAPLAEGGSSNN